MTTKRKSVLERYFYLFMSLLITVVVVYGFSYTINQNLLHPRIQPPQVVYLHSFVFSAWLLFFILQSALVRSHNVRLHRTLGWVGTAFAVAIVVLGYTTSTAVLRLAVQLRLPFPTVSFLFVEIMELVCFAVPFALAIYWRKRPDFHRRLMLIATCALTEAAFGRIPSLPNLFAPAGVDALILLGVLRDILVERRIHKVYLYAIPAMIFLQIFAEYTSVHQSSWWIGIGNSLIQ
ncbi:magnesium-transporting ATPase (P-type) [Silvibacterium bohemicum]|uniref:Magnesium-transporting ATPase (P-type) n=1 Tax=Silvibacterium bohemicum TaxID=1577686 RepID=A0A841JV98_9BACT|nr:hypothetical protein [Silvibacterium bohemicum]MBB6143669.1 magnesium-transporting ATPase (P-type) [Silvibacterium bohemicum]